MTVNDDQISAWLDGSVDEAEHARLGALIAADPNLSARAAQLKRIDDLFREAVPLEQALPAELMARLGLSDAPAATDNVVSLAAVRAARVETAAAAPARPVFGSRSWRIAAQVALVLGIGVTAGQWILSPQDRAPDGRYQTLGDASGTGTPANAVVKFGRATTAREAVLIASRAGARVIGAPTEAGAWRLSVDPAHRDAVLEKLRAMPQVNMAEPIDGTAR